MDPNFETYLTQEQRNRYHDEPEREWVVYRPATSRSRPSKPRVTRRGLGAALILAGERLQGTMPLPQTDPLIDSVTIAQTSRQDVAPAEHGSHQQVLHS